MLLVVSALGTVFGCDNDIPAPDRGIELDTMLLGSDDSINERTELLPLGGSTADGTLLGGSDGGDDSKEQGIDELSHFQHSIPKEEQKAEMIEGNHDDAQRRSC